jgi:Tol biopolymer transport system component
MNCFEWLRRLILAATITAAAILLATGSAGAAPPVRLTDDGRQKMDPVFVSGGKQIVYTELVSYNLLCVKRLTLATGKAERLHPSAGSSEFGMSFSADGKRLAWLQNDGNLHVKIVLEDAETGVTTDYNPGAGFAAIRNLSVAPDGGRLLFAFPEGPGQQIFSLSSDGKTRQAITDGDSFDACPAFSPDGKQIAFTSTRAGDFDIWTMSADGAGATRLTTHRGLDTRPAWSPDGRQLAFTSLRDGNYDIYVMRADGSNLRRVTNHPERDDFPRWHPDGKHLVLVSERNGRQDLFLIEAP